MECYAKDRLKDPFYAWLEAGGRWGQIATAWVVYFMAGMFGATLMGGGIAEPCSSA